LSNRVFKNHQINLGMPFQIKAPLNFQTIKTIDVFEQNEEFESLEIENTDVPVENDVEEIIRRAKLEASMIVKEAQFEALRIVEAAENESTEIRTNTETEARENGYNDGYADAKKQIEEALKDAEFIKEQAKTEYGEILSGIESEAVSLIMDIAENVIGQQLKLNKENILHLVKQAFEKSANKDSVVLKVSREDYEYIESNKENLLAMVEGIGELNIQCDNSLKTGGCLVETTFGSIDASAQTKLKKIEEAFNIAVGM